MEVMERERERARERMLVLVKRKKIAMERAAALAAEDRSIFEKQVACQLLRIEDGIYGPCQDVSTSASTSLQS